MFYLGGKTKYENFFDIRNPKIKDLINFAQRNGYVIGIHPSYMAGENVLNDEFNKSFGGNLWFLRSKIRDNISCGITYQKQEKFWNN
ncbi:MAG: hypothetical protein U0T36_08570 [Saprospiraceae bacterium]